MLEATRLCNMSVLGCKYIVIELSSTKNICIFGSNQAIIENLNHLKY